MQKKRLVIDLFDAARLVKFQKSSGITFLIITLFLFISANNAYSQELKHRGRMGGGRGYFMFGFNNLDIKNLNTALENKGYSKLSDNFLSFGGGGHGIINRFIIGGEGHGLIGEEANSENYKSSLSVGYGFFDFGYIVYSIGGLNVYPLLGIGGGGITLKISEKVPPSFDAILDNPKRGVEISTGGLLLNIAVGADYLLNLGDRKWGNGGLVFGLRIGYTYSPIKSDWQFEEGSISDGPETGITGPYLRLMIGGGGGN